MCKCHEDTIHEVLYGFAWNIICWMAGTQLVVETFGGAAHSTCLSTLYLVPDSCLAFSSCLFWHQLLLHQMHSLSLGPETEPDVHKFDPLKLSATGALSFKLLTGNILSEYQDSRLGQGFDSGRTRSSLRWSRLSWEQEAKHELSSHREGERSSEA